MDENVKQIPLLWISVQKRKTDSTFGKKTFSGRINILHEVTLKQFLKCDKLNNILQKIILFICPWHTTSTTVL